MSIHASIGIAGGSATRVTADELMRNADVAMYVAKANGKGRVVTFETDMATALTNRTQMTADLRRAIVEDQLTLHYQPVFDLESGHIVGTEALVRWNHPSRGADRTTRVHPARGEIQPDRGPRSVGP